MNAAFSPIYYPLYEHLDAHLSGTELFYRIDRFRYGPLEFRDQIVYLRDDAEVLAGIQIGIRQSFPGSALKDRLTFFPVKLDRFFVIFRAECHMMQPLAMLLEEAG